MAIEKEDTLKHKLYCITSKIASNINVIYLYKKSQTF